MAFFTRPDLSDIQFKQLSGSSINLSGSTRIADSGTLIVDGDLVLDGKQIVATGVTGVDVFAGDVLTLDVDGKIKLMPSGSGGTGFYNDYANPKSSIPLGGIAVNTALTGKTFTQLFKELLVPYVAPAFGPLGVGGQPTTIEVGTALSGSRTFTWSTSNSGNVLTNASSVLIRDVTNSAVLRTNLPPNGSIPTGITTNPMSTNGATQVWRAEAINTNLVPFNSSNFTVTANFIRFFGPTVLSPTNSATVRALSPGQSQTANVNTFTLNTGNALTKFVVALPPSRTITSVIDVDALNANITSQYIYTGTISVLDNGGVGPTTHLYRIYEMNNGVPYSSSHQHVITTA